MLTFRNLNIVTIILLLVLVITQAVWWAYLLLFLVYMSIGYWGTTEIASQFHMSTICQAPNHPTKEIALTFDDGITNPAQTNAILDILKKYDAKATFFCIGKHLELPAQVETLQRLHQEGHLIGNHSYSHAYTFDFYSAPRIVQELQQADEKIASIIGQQPTYFRPPFGLTTPQIAKAVEQTGHQTIGWSVRSFDTMITDEQKLLKRVVDRLHNGAIVLFHDHLPQTSKVLPLFLEYLLNNGYRIKNIDQLLGLSPYKK